MFNLREWMGQQPALGEGVYVDPQATVIGNVRLGAHSSVWPGAVIRGDMHRIDIGERCSIQDNASLHVTHASKFNPEGWPLYLGDEVTVGHNACLHGCTVGSRVLVGIGAVVLDGAVIEDEVVVGAGSLVPPGKTLQRGFLYLGSPCKPVRRLSEEELSFFSYSAQNYVKLKNGYLETTL